MTRTGQKDAEADQIERTEAAASDVSRVRRILVVDNDPAICEVLQEGLAATGFIVACASGGSEARRILQGGATDVALLDVNMPGENGLSLAEYAQAMGAVVIMMTGHPDTMTALDQFAHRRLYKPFRLADLLAAIEETAAPGHFARGRSRAS